MPQTLPSVKPTLVIVESPAKCAKIEGFLGPAYRCMATFGHIRELRDLKDVDVANDFKPSFSPVASKSQQLAKLKRAIRECGEVLLATDDDREGEGIAWHVCAHFGLPLSTKRIIFHEITKSAILQAVQNPGALNMNLVGAQQSRQVLDLIVGFKLSPVLWSHITQKSARGLSAGRCQTPALRIIYENDQDIAAAPGKSVYNTTGHFTDRSIPFALQKHHDSAEAVEEFLVESANFEHIFTCSSPKQVTRSPPSPYTTSGVQQAASNEMRISPKDTMKILQTLYEGGYITYMRTDSTTYSEEFIVTAKSHIGAKWGDKYVHKDVDRLSLRSESKPKGGKKSKKGGKDEHAQEAHEAIRPTNIGTITVKESMHGREKRMYEMIWRNTVESCMSPAVFTSVTAKLTAPEGTEYRCTEEEAVFLGWKVVRGLPKAEGIPLYNYLLSLKRGGEIPYLKIASKVTLKDLKTHYTEAKLVQLLEQRGIGRPSTFSSLVDKIQEREYVKKGDIKGKKVRCVDFVLEGEELEETTTEREFGNEKDKLILQPLGKLVLEFLLEHFRGFFEYEYTKGMEDALDGIAKGQRPGHDLCRGCYDEIETLVKPLRGNGKVSIPIDQDHTYIVGKYGPVIKCSVGGKTTFKPVRKDIDLERLRSGGYTLAEVEQQAVIAGNVLGRHEGRDVVLKKGKYGLYVTWGGKNRSLSSIGIEEADITLDDVSKHLAANTTVLRQLTDGLSLRKGKYGDYVYYQTSDMKRPQFLKLKGFGGNARSCDTGDLVAWVADTYGVK